MQIAYYNWGGKQIEAEHLDPAVQRVYQTCLNNPSCEVLELRSDLLYQSQSVIADFADGTFDIDNSTGIHRVERLALTYSTSTINEFRWQVRALRQGFPITIHQNHVLEGEPRSLCLYIEPWHTVERSWTPELFIKRIFWWLRATAEETIHGDDQPLERLFFSSPYDVVLPHNFFNEEAGQKKLSFVAIEHKDVKTTTLIGRYHDKASANVPLCVPVTIVLDPIENGPVEEYPYTLGQLQCLLESRGKGIIDLLKKAFFELVTEDGIEFQRDKKEFVLLLLGIPRLRNGVIERIEAQGFIVDSELGKLGESLSALFKAPDQNKWFKESSLCKLQSESWKPIPLTPVNVKCYPAPEEIRQYSGLDSADAGPKGIIAGVGALGGLLAKIWNRECWGEWYFIDNDIIKSHNIVRHIASHHFIGYPKALVVSSTVNDIHKNNENKEPRYSVNSILSDDPEVLAEIDSADVIVDASTTLHVPREVSQRENAPRMVSVFITPSGMSCVMLLEDKDRKIRNRSLESQYYRAILNSDWGIDHLTGHIGRQWVGAGCREVTLAMSDELIQLHSAILSRQVRKSLTLPEAKICVWDYQDDLGEIVARNVPIFPSHSILVGEWEVNWDDGFWVDVTALRLAELPNETGGILFGIIDQKDKTITLVKACSAPENSESTSSSFGRGEYDSTDVLDDCHSRTAGIVSYVGEWHSHPKGYTALPSQADVGQLCFLTDSLQTEGLPALMLIVSDLSLGFYLDKQGRIFSPISSY